MSSSSTARQAEFDFYQDEVRPGRFDQPASATASADILKLPRFPTFTYTSSVESAASRMAGRLNAAAISGTEHQRLLDERQALLDKQIARNISPQELNRLKYVRWSLDRVDDARYG